MIDIYLSSLFSPSLPVVEYQNDFKDFINQKYLKSGKVRGGPCSTDDRDYFSCKISAVLLHLA